MNLHENLTPGWVPSPEFIETTNIAWLMQRVGVTSYEALHAWSTQHREAFWGLAIERLGIRFQRPFSCVLDMSCGVEAPRWLVDARFNIAESCFTADAASPAIIYQVEGGALRTVSVGELKALTDRVTASLVSSDFKPGDVLAVYMPMTVEAVAIYLGIIQAGCVVAGIADSFRPREVATRLRLAQAIAVFTQDAMLRGGKELSLYAHLLEADAPPAIVLPARDKVSLPLRTGDKTWDEFLRIGEGMSGSIAAVSREPDDHLNILFSSGTTGEPKAIPWTQATPLKCAADAHFHQDVQPGDVLVWPTNLGWMMGPWLIFASLLNRATMGLYYGAPTGREFCHFVQDAGATMLGVVPSLVKAWRDTDCAHDLDWSALKVFSSTGECSNAEDMRWLMAQAGGRPVIEYCGGTEIGGAYITGTVTRDGMPGTFNTPALGLDFVILDAAGQPAPEGEVFIVPPSIGLSTSLLNGDHHATYFTDTPHPDGQTVRRHGDWMEALSGGYWRAHGRADDTMNLGGIKVSCVEIEQVLRGIEGVTETAAVAVAPGGGPSRLVIYAVCNAEQTLSQEELMTAMQQVVKRDLNPLFKIYDLILTESLPRTASHKMLRRVLRDQYMAQCGAKP